KKYEHLPIDTKYFKDLELEILSLFDDLDKSLDGWLIKSENYQALNTILPKLKEKVQTIYIDPPFNLDSSDQFLYRTNYKDANWATLLENRLRIAKEWLNEKGSIFVRCDYNGNWIVRCLMDGIFGVENFTNEININRSKIAREGISLGRFATATDTIFYYRISETSKFYVVYKPRGRETQWHKMHSPFEYKSKIERIVDGETFIPPMGRHWSFTQEKINKLLRENRIRIVEEEYIDVFGKKQHRMLEYLESEEQPVDTNWTDIPGYTSTTGFQTENSEKLLNRVIRTASEKNDLVMDFFLGSGTTTAVAHKLKRKWIGVEMGEHFYSVVLPRMKKVLAYDKSGISKEVKEYQGGGFFKYYELEQYDDVLANTVYNDHEMNNTYFNKYIFMKDENDINYNKVNFDLSNIDIAETISNLTGKWVKKINNSNVEFEDGMIVNIKDIDYKMIKPLIWWE
ncbi:MAG: site-specific DNA-methyltransferase, partial [Candidatus Micrarchaeaceae archaeon]